MLLKTCAVIVICLLSPALWAGNLGPCAGTGTLATYSGNFCVFGPLEFNFGKLAGTLDDTKIQGGHSVSNANTNVTWASSGNTISLTFDSNLFVDSGTWSFSYIVTRTGGVPVSASLTATVSRDPVFGNAYVQQTGGSVSLLVGTPPNANGTWTDGPESPTGDSFNVFNTISTNDAGGMGSATVSSFTNTFTYTDNAVPEPASLVTLGGALIGMGLWRRRRVCR